MLDCRVPPPFDLKGIGLFMSRPRWQEGSIRREKRKRGDVWVGRWRKYVDDQPREQMSTLGLVSELTKSDARIELRKIIDRNGEPESSAASPAAAVVPTISEVATAYLEFKRPQWGTRHYRDMKNLFKNNINGDFGSTKMNELTPITVQEWLNKVEGKSYSLAHKLRTYSSALFEYAIKAKMVTENPAEELDLPKTAAVDETFYSEEECLMMLAGTQGAEHLILRIFLTTGIRPGETFALRVDDVFPGKLRIDEALDEEYDFKDTKSEESNSFVPLPAMLELELRSYIAAHGIKDAQLLFADRRSKKFGDTVTNPNNYLRYVLRPKVEKAGVADLNYQALRRTTATHVTRRASPKVAQRMLRHRDGAVTMKHYIKTIPEDVSKASASWDLALRAKPENERNTPERQM